MFHLPLARWTRLTLGSVKEIVENSTWWPEGADAEGGADGHGADDGLGAEGGVLVDDEVGEGEAGERKEVEGDVVEMDGTAEALADAGGDAVLEAADVDERRDESEEDRARAG